MITIKSFKNCLILEEQNVSRKGLQGRITQLLPVSFFESSFLFVGVYAFDPDSCQFLYSILPEDLKTPGSLALLIGYEYNCRLNMDKSIRWLRSASVFSLSSCRINNFCASCRLLQLEVSQFNKICSDLIYSFKLVCLSIATTGVYFFIRLHETQPFVAVVALSLGLYSGTFYVIVFDKAFTIPRMVQDLKDEILLAEAKVAFRVQNTGARRYLESVNNVVIK
ncbi:unnamed protein product, partial [Allacma fusca]